METRAYKTAGLILASLFLLTTTIMAQEELTKEFHKDYTAGQGSRLELNNRYGDIIVSTSQSNQVVIDVKVTVRYPSREKAEKLLSYIDVQFNEGSDFVSARTVIDDRFNFSGWGSDSRRFTINYDVKMPEWMNLTLVNKYGNSNLDDLSGLVNLDIKYGNLTASKLSRGNEKPLNTVTLSYGKGNIDEAGWLNMVMRYVSNFSIPKCKAVLLDSKYSTVQIDYLSSLVGDTKYNKLRISEINNLVLNAGYDEVSIGTLNKKLDYTGAYGSLNIEKVPAGFEAIDVDSRYMGVKLGIDEAASYKLDAHSSYGSIKFNEDNFRNHKRIIDNNSSEISGLVGKEEEPKATVKVQASYGSIRLD
jgi:hypothetical protein